MTDPSSSSPGEPESLDGLRRGIDELDSRIVKLLNERAELVVRIGHLKQDGQTPVYAPDREQRVLDRICEANEGPLPDACVQAVYRELMSGSFALERPPRIGYLGPAGSFSHLAARRQFGACVEYQDVGSIGDVFRAIETEQLDLGLVPIENTTGGGIQETLDAFLHTAANVCAEVLIPIHHHVLSRSPLEEIQRIYSRPEVFEQCRGRLAEHLPHVERVPVQSTARAAQIAAEESTAGAIGSSLAGRLYELTTVMADVEDNPHNVTRFFVIGRQHSAPTAKDKTAVLFTAAHQPGALAGVLDVFREHGINLTHIDKRPSPRVNWEYFFFVDCEGHAQSPELARALEAARGHCLSLRVLGSFPQARDALQG